MLERRAFIVVGTLLGLGTYIHAREHKAFSKSFESVKEVIFLVQIHMFPKQNSLPSAEETGTINFLYETIKHTSYDKEIREFVIDGAKELMQREKNLFKNMNKEEREIALRSYEETPYGSAWLSRIMTLTMEGLFSDPIYGANPREIGWKKLHTYGGYPRAEGRYLEHV
jgi:gluconate 2-dehydrogenase gamma chain